MLQGGADIAPKATARRNHPEWAGDRVRDVYEMELLHEFVEAGKPVLGICRGAQMINVAFGGTLYQDINSLVPDTFAHRNAETYDKNYHGITIEPDSGLARLYPGKSGGKVNSIHHQSVKTLGRDLVIEAWSENRSHDRGDRGRAAVLLGSSGIRFLLPATRRCSTTQSSRIPRRRGKKRRRALTARQHHAENRNTATRSLAKIGDTPASANVKYRPRAPRSARGPAPGAPAHDG